MKEVTHLMCLTFDGAYTMLVEFDAPEDFTKPALLAVAAEKARKQYPLIKNLPVTNQQYCGTLAKAVFVR